MTPLRQRMLYELQRRNYSPSTIRGYLGAVRAVCPVFRLFTRTSRAQSTCGAISDICCREEAQARHRRMRISALRFLYKRTMKQHDKIFDDLIFPKVPHKLPTVLSQDEVVRLIEAAPNRLYRMILVLLYATGVRRTEAAQIKVEDIDSQRMVIHIRQGKGARNRAMCRSRRSCSKNCAVGGGGRSRAAISFPAPRVSVVPTSPSPTRPSGTPAAQRLRAQGSRRRSIRIHCGTALRRTCSKPAPTCARFSC